MLPLLPMQPRFLEKLWGGTRISALPARRGAMKEGTAYGESWEVADLPEGTCSVGDGPLKGRTLASLSKEHGAALFGRFHVEGRFPLLVKLVDAAAALSVQVHPDAAYASTHPGTWSKDEAWLVVHAEPGARLLHGAKEGVDAAAFRRAIDGNRADALLRSVEVQPGDVVHVPPGTLHAIGEGILILEVQEPSDTTFRVYDYARLENGKPRALHVEQAMEVSNFGAQPPVKQARRVLSSGDGVVREVLVTSRAFEMQSVRMERGARAEIALPEGTPAVVFALDGAMRADGAASAVDIVRGDSLVVPASAGAFTLTASGPSTAIVMMPTR